MRARYGTHVDTRTIRRVRAKVRFRWKSAFPIYRIVEKEQAQLIKSAVRALPRALQGAAPEVRHGLICSILGIPPGAGG